MKPSLQWPPSRNTVPATIVLALCCLSGAAPAAPVVATYNVAHRFEFPAAPAAVNPGQVWRGAWGYSGRTGARTAQPPCNDPDSYGPASEPIAPNMNGFQLAASFCPNDAGGLADSSVTLNNFGLGTRISGRIDATGLAFADLTNPGNTFSIGSAQSRSALVIQSGIQNRAGRIEWGSIWRGEVSGSAVAIAGTPPRVNIFDPIDFSLFDIDTGELLLQDRLLDIQAAVRGTGGFDGSIAWDADAGQFVVNAHDADFSIVMESAFGLSRGSLFLEIRGGLVTRSDDTGLFDGLLPSLGTLGSFSLPLGSITVDYDLGDLDRFGQRNLDLEFGFSGGGEAFAQRISEPWTLPLLALAMLGAIARPARRQGDESAPRAG